VKRLFQHSITLLVLPLIAACDPHNGLMGPGGRSQAASAANFPNGVGSYAGTAVAHARLSTGQTYSISCPIDIAVATQSDDDFSGSFTLRDSDDCDTESGTVTGTVQTDGAVSLVADTPGGGANVFEDAAARTGCTLVSGSGDFRGAVSGGLLSASGNAVYRCPKFFNVRADVDVSISAARL